MSCQAHGTAQGWTDSEVKLLVPLVSNTGSAEIRLNRNAYGLLKKKNLIHSFYFTEAVAKEISIYSHLEVFQSHSSLNWQEQQQVRTLFPFQQKAQHKANQDITQAVDLLFLRHKAA